MGATGKPLATSSTLTYMRPTGIVHAGLLGIRGGAHSRHAPGGARGRRHAGLRSARPSRRGCGVPQRSSTSTWCARVVLILVPLTNGRHNRRARGGKGLDLIEETALLGADRSSFIGRPWPGSRSRPRYQPVSAGGAARWDVGLEKSLRISVVTGNYASRAALISDTQ